MLSIIIIMAIFAVLHSLTAGQRSKRFIQNQFGERAYHGLYRLGYNIVSVLTLAPALIFVSINGGENIWRVGSPWSVVMAIVQLAGLLGLLVSLAQIDWLRFAGLAQLRAYLDGDPSPLSDEPLQTGGLYGLVRHPLYLFSLLALWPMSTMSAGLLAFNIAATLYFVSGSLLEERRMVASFGQVYVDYQGRVPWLIPFARF